MTNIQEIWKDVPEWEDAYSVSNIGRIWSKRMNKPLAIRLNNNGYPVADLFTRRKGIVRRKTAYVHRLVALAFVDGYKPNLYVDHIDCDKTNNIYTNLRWVSNSENVSKEYKLGKSCKSNKFVKQPVYITTKPRVYFNSMTDCAKSLGLPRERIKTVLRFFDGRLPELGIRVVRCDTSAVTTSQDNDVESSDSKCLSNSLSERKI